MNKWGFVCDLLNLCTSLPTSILWRIVLYLQFAYNIKHNKVQIDCNFQKKEKIVAIKECNGKYKSTPNTRTQTQAHTNVRIK